MKIVTVTLDEQREKREPRTIQEAKRLIEDASKVAEQARFDFATVYRQDEVYFQEAQRYLAAAHHAMQQLERHWRRYEEPES